ncbi:MAG: SDR family oxidoreductase [Alphaproteobacteria bacterium]|nr:SDR family oxidoreductase [Alphaproteobacteria bacterium]
MILVTGVMGKVGSEVARQLMAAGAATCALVRDRAKMGSLPKGVEPAFGSLDDPASLDRACAGVEAVFMGSFENPDVLRLQANLIAAAKRAGVKRLARLSALSTDEASPVPFARTHAKGDRQVIESGIGGIALRPGWFHQNFLTYFPKGVLRAAAGQGRVAFIDVRDIAAVAIKVLSAPGWEGSAIDLSGPEALSHADVAAILSRATGRTFTYADVEPAAYRRETIAGGASPYYADVLDYLYERIRSGQSATLADGVHRVLGRDPIPLARFAQDHAGALIDQL